jgi:hypothetical protein
MSSNSNKFQRRKVRAENPTGACGYIDHMTIDELRERAVGEEFDATCPSCGMFHLTRKEIDQINSEKFTESQDFADLRNEAEESG